MKIVVCTHGKSAKALVESAEMIAGKQEDIIALDFQAGGDLANLKQNLEKEILETEDSVLVLVDLKGGTPFNVSFPLVLQKDNAELVTGVNIAMLIELFLARTSDIDVQELAKMAVVSGVTSVENVSKTIIDVDTNVEDGI